tara:strand:- start:5 stop:496 length:492 start_codon:yes stop_codon:yes gene_type:complete
MRAKLTPPANGQIYDVGLNYLAVAIADTPTIQGARFEIFDYNISGANHLQESFCTFRFPKINCNASLIPVHCLFCKRSGEAYMRLPLQSLVARHSNPNYVGAIVGQKTRRHRAGPSSSRIDNANACKGSRKITSGIPVKFPLIHNPRVDTRSGLVQRELRNIF